MKPQLKLAEAITPDGARLTLHSHDGNFTVRLNGQALMDSTLTTSERQMGELATAHLKRFSKSRVLVGGLGLGFTLRSTLTGVGPHGAVELVELLPVMAEWNRTFLRELNGALVDDPRVTLRLGDVGQVIARAAAGRYDAILLDTDNGPSAMVQRANARLYSEAGLRQLFAALRPSGRAVIWSASHDRAFAARLTAAGFAVEAVAAKLHATAKRPAATLYVAVKPAAV